MAAPPLVGRDEERTRLTDALARCRSGRGGVVLVSGEAGIGKSRLVAEALSGWDGVRRAATAVPGAGAYAVLARALQGAPGIEGVAGDPVAVVASAVRALGDDGPAVLVLDDLHLADSATVEVLAAVDEALSTAPVLVLGLYRSDGLARAHPIRALRAELRRAGRLTDVALRPFGEPETGALLGALLGATPSPDLVATVQRRTDGLPFFVEELTTALLEADRLQERAGVVDLAADAALPVPETVADAVLARTAELRREHETAVEWAVVLGVQVDLPTLAALAGGAEVDLLIETGLLVEFDASTAAFRHALIRDALHRSIPWARRRRLHEAVAELLETSGATPAVVAEHWIDACRPARAGPLLLAAAEQHRAAHAYRDAARLAGRALALWPDGDDAAGRVVAAETLAACTELGGDPGAAAAMWTGVASRCAATGDPEGSGRAHARAANAAVLAGDVVATALARLAAADAFERAGALDDAAEQRLALGGQLRSAGRLSEALEQATAATRLAERSGRRDVQAHALALEGAVRAALGERRGVELARAALEMAVSVEVAGVAAEAQYALAESLEYAADYAAAVDAYESAFELCRAEGLGEFASICFVCMSPASRLMGRWDRTLAICAEVLADDDSTELTRRVAEEESGLITALRGDHRRARGPLRRAAEFGRAQGIVGLEVGATWGLAVVHELAEDEAGARAMVARLLERCGSTEECHYALPALRWAAGFLADRGDVPALGTCHRILAAAATRSGSAKVLSALAHVGAELALAEGDAAGARSSFARSVELLAGITAPLDRALAQLGVGRASAAAGDPDTAVAALTDAHRWARHLGARPLAHRCAVALADLGAPVDRRTGPGALPGGLTGREREVLLRLAEGRTNREVAAELFLSTRTVDMHVRNVFTKLGCSSRAAATRWAVEQGLLPAGR